MKLYGQCEPRSGAQDQRDRAKGAKPQTDPRTGGATGSLEHPCPANRNIVGSPALALATGADRFRCLSNLCDCAGFGTWNQRAIRIAVAFAILPKHMQAQSCQFAEQGNLGVSEVVAHQTPNPGIYQHVRRIRALGCIDRGDKRGRETAVNIDDSSVSRSPRETSHGCLQISTSFVKSGGN